MAIVLGVSIVCKPLLTYKLSQIGAHVYSSINQARQEAEFKRAQALESEYEKKMRRLSGSQNSALMDNQKENWGHLLWQYKDYVGGIQVISVLRNTHNRKFPMIIG